MNFAMACQGAICTKTASEMTPTTALLHVYKAYSLSRGLRSRGATPRVNVSGFWYRRYERQSQDTGMSSTIPDGILRKAPLLEPFGMLVLFGVLTALPIVLTLRLVEPALVLPALSPLLFAEAAIAALAARVIHVRTSAANLTLWDFAGAFTFMGCAAAILGEPDQAALFFEEQAVLRPVSRP